MQSHVHHSPRPTQIQEEQTQTEKCQCHTVERTHGWDTLVWPSLKITLAILCGVFVKIKWQIFQKTILQRCTIEPKTWTGWGTLRRPLWTGNKSVAQDRKMLVRRDRRGQWVENVNYSSFTMLSFKGNVHRNLEKEMWKWHLCHKSIAVYTYASLSDENCLFAYLSSHAWVIREGGKWC